MIPTIRQAIEAFRDALNCGTFDLSPSGEQWTEDWWKGKAASGRTRQELLGRGRAEEDLKDFCGKIRDEKRWLDALAHIESDHTGEPPAVSAGVLKRFEGAMSLLATKYCS